MRRLGVGVEGWKRGRRMQITRVPAVLENKDADIEKKSLLADILFCFCLLFFFVYVYAFSLPEISVALAGTTPLNAVSL